MRTACISAALLLFILAINADAAELAVVVHPSNPSATLDARAVRSLFLKTQPNWKHGERVRPIDLAEQSPQRSAFLDKVLGLTAAEFERYWVERQYSQGDIPPLKAADEASVIKFVSTLTGTIAFVSKEAAEHAGKNVKIIMKLEY
jgi:ABC-type phosphate transport system substrate-binding protein